MDGFVDVIRYMIRRYRFKGDAVLVGENFAYYIVIRDREFVQNWWLVCAHQSRPEAVVLSFESTAQTAMPPRVVSMILQFPNFCIQALHDRPHF